MKIGFRKPNLMKRIKSRTTGKLKRKAKKMVNPLYGKKGMGFIKNPSRSIKNSVYHKVTIDPINFVASSSKKKSNQINNNSIKKYNKNIMLILCSLGFIGFGGIHDFYLGNITKGFVKFFTMNWFMIGTIIDLIKILSESY